MNLYPSNSTAYPNASPTAPPKRQPLTLSNVSKEERIERATIALREVGLEKHINKKCPEVAVLSAFPLYVLDYYGSNETRKKLNP